MRRIFVPLDEKQLTALILYAEKQYRDPRVQAALFIQRGLEQMGELEPEQEPAQSTPEVSNERP
jgi:hypothetical protein